MIAIYEGKIYAYDSFDASGGIGFDDDLIDDVDDARAYVAEHFDSEEE